MHSLAISALAAVVVVGTMLYDVHATPISIHPTTYGSGHLARRACSTWWGCDDGSSSSSSSSSLVSLSLSSLPVGRYFTGRSYVVKAVGTNATSILPIGTNTTAGAKQDTATQSLLANPGNGTIPTKDLEAQPAASPNSSLPNSTGSSTQPSLIKPVTTASVPVDPNVTPITPQVPARHSTNAHSHHTSNADGSESSKDSQDDNGGDSADQDQGGNNGENYEDGNGSDDQNSA